MSNFAARFTSQIFAMHIVNVVTYLAMHNKKYSKENLLLCLQFSKSTALWPRTLWVEKSQVQCRSFDRNYLSTNPHPSACC